MLYINCYRHIAGNDGKSRKENKYLPSCAAEEKIRELAEGIENEIKWNDKVESSVQFHILISVCTERKKVEYFGRKC
jgi:hypothetical protein